jgi:glycosyltransferase involved in cell wall biosynthesis
MWLAHYTDVIITINHEDYQAAQKFKLRRDGRVYYIPGVGVNTKDYQCKGIYTQELRQTLGLREEDIALIAMGDLLHGKNYHTSLKAIARTSNPKLHFLICGKGPELDMLQKLAKDLNVEKQIHFLGFRTDIKELVQAADIFLFTSYREGLSRSMMEAMAAGLPCIASKIRGNTDLILDGEGGYLREADDVDGFALALNELAADDEMRKCMGLCNLETIKQFDVEIIKSRIKELYYKELS